MARPVEQNSESTPTESHRTLPTPFLTKTYQLVDDHTVDDVISWNEDGSGFIVWNPSGFARDLLPKYFKHNNFSSFVRQLNTYGFRKLVPDRWEFSNDYFRRGEKWLLCEIQRRKISTTVVPAAAVPVVAIPIAKPVISPSNSGEEQVISSNSSPIRAPPICTDTELMDDNERLRKENGQLLKDLTEMKSMCNNIFSLMSNYANNHNQVAESGFPADDVQVAKPLDLFRRFPGEEDDEDGRARLFGVEIGAKRAREDDGVAAEYGGDLQLHQPVSEMKSEPMDCEIDGGDDHDKQ